MKKICYCLLSAALLVSCGGNNLKRVLVISRGPATIDKDTKTITVTSGSSSEEQTVDFDTKDKITLQINSQAGKASVDLDAPGYYVLNAKPDTIVGSYQRYGAPPKETQTFTQEFIKHQIDSLQGLIKDSNVSAANRNYFILPNHVVRVTDNTDAFIVGPFHQMTSIQQQGNKEPEVYRFYMVSEIRETLDHLKSLTVAPPSPNQ
jgi:hypothetical protein